MDLLRPIVKNISFDWYLRHDGLKIKKPIKELRESQYLSTAELQYLRFGKLKKLIRHAYDFNQFYRQRFDKSGFSPEDLKEFSDLEKLPLLTKDEIRSAGANLFSDGYSADNCFHNRTGGSTGVPIHTYMDSDAVAFKKAAMIRHNSWANLNRGDRLACVWGDTTKRLPFKENLRNVLTDRAFYLDTLLFDEQHIITFLEQIRQLKPTVIMGHAHSIFRLAEFVRDNKIINIKFDGIITTAMVLSDIERQTIEAAFVSPVFNRYGCEELSLIASECEAHRGMHIFAEGLHVELLGEDKNIPRKLVITDLVNLGMPMIRYEIGDYAIVTEGDCPCGRTLPRLKEVSGRSADFLYRPDKKPVFGISILDTFVIHIPGIKQMQIVQERYDHLDFFVVRDEKFSEDSLKKLKENVIDIFGDKMKYDIFYVESIKQTERGKYRFSICNINRESP
jgi:phenylacetate-CoA ligase